MDLYLRNKICMVKEAKTNLIAVGLGGHGMAIEIETETGIGIVIGTGEMGGIEVVMVVAITGTVAAGIVIEVGMVEAGTKVEEEEAAVVVGDGVDVGTRILTVHCLPSACSMVPPVLGYSHLNISCVGKFTPLCSNICPKPTQQE